MRPEKVTAWPKTEANLEYCSDPRSSHFIYLIMVSQPAFASVIYGPCLFMESPYKRTLFKVSYGCCKSWHHLSRYHLVTDETCQIGGRLRPHIEDMLPRRRATLRQVSGKAGRWAAGMRRGYPRGLSQGLGQRTLSLTAARLHRPIFHL